MPEDGPQDGHLDAYAQSIAPHIDRLAIAVHRYARPATRRLLGEFGLRDAGLLVDLRSVLLAEPVTLDDVAVVDRYMPRAALAVALDAHVRQDLLWRDGAARPVAYACTTRGRDLLLRLTTLQSETIGVLWAIHAAALPSLVALATDVTDYAAATLPLDAYPAFRLWHAAPVPLGAATAYVLLERVTALRYLRADAHAHALALQSLDAPQGHALSTLWHAEEPRAAADAGAPRYDAATVEPSLAALCERGLVEAIRDRWCISAAGSALREAIEAETDHGAAAAFAVLNAADRDRFLHGLAQLPS